MAQAAPAIPYILAAAGTVAQLTAAQDASAERKRSIAQMLDVGTTGSAANRNVALTNAAQYQPDARAPVINDQSARVNQLLNDVQTAGTTASPPVVPNANVSGDFTRGQLRSDTNAEAERVRLNQLLANVMAVPQTQRLEGYKTAEAASQAAQIGSTTGSKLTGLKGDYGQIEPNPYLTLGGGLATASAPLVADSDARTRAAAALAKVMKPTGTTPPINASPSFS